MRVLYYTIDKETHFDFDEDVTTGTKFIYVYEVALDIPKLWFDLEIPIASISVTEIERYLKDNGFGDRNYKLIRL